MNPRPASRAGSRIRWLAGPALTCCAAGMGWAASGQARWSLFVLLGFVAAGIALLRYRSGRVTRAEIFAWAVAARLTLLWLPPVLSDDAYRFVWDGMLQTQGINPYLFTPDDEALQVYRNEEIYSRLNSASYHTVYPPASQAVFAIGGAFYEQGWETSYFVVKGIFALAEVAALWMLLGLFRSRYVLLYAWNPLVLIVTAGQPHGEALAVALLVGVLWLARRGSGAGASVLLALAGLVKLIPFLLFPFLWRRFGWRGLWPGILVTIVFSIPYVHPDVPLNVLSSLRLYVTLFEFNAGPYYLLKGAIALMTGFDASWIVGPLFGLVFLLLVARAYRLDAREAPSLRSVFAGVFALYVALATTVHPWYLLPVLALTAGARRPSWHWLWLSVASIGTYLLYVGGPYWAFVIMGWSGWFILLVHGYRAPILAFVLERRARAKAGRVAALLPALGPEQVVLDLGAAEGYVGRAVARRTGASVVLADVRPGNRTDLPYVVFDGARLPFSDRHFDVTLLYFVLHHAREPERLLAEAMRVTGQFIVVAESVVESESERRRLSRLDAFFNRLRGGAKTGEIGDAVALRSHGAWRRLFDQSGAHIAAEFTRGRFLHRQSYFLLHVPGAPLRRRPLSGVSPKSVARTSS